MACGKLTSFKDCFCIDGIHGPLQWTTRLDVMPGFQDLGMNLPKLSVRLLKFLGWLGTKPPPRTPDWRLRIVRYISRIQLDPRYCLQGPMPFP